MGLAGRVKRVERAMGLTGPCWKCGGAGRFVVTMEEPGDPQPEGCPECGGLVHVRILMLDDEGVETVRARRAAKAASP